jgi:hypothetical protein
MAKRKPNMLGDEVLHDIRRRFDEEKYIVERAGGLLKLPTWIRFLSV